MTTGYLWTGQYEEAKRVIEKGNGQSMELDEDTLDGHWSTDSKSGMDFFIINDAIFSKLCILGEDVEPWFEGASVTAPQVSRSFTKVDENFKQTLFTMMQDLKFAFEGGKDMELEEKVTNEEEITEAAEEVVEENEAIETETTSIEEASAAEYEAEEAEEGETPSEEIDEPAEEEETEETTEPEVEAEEAEIEEEEVAEESEPETVSVEEYSALKAKYEELLTFKNAIEKEKKENLINSFWMLSDEDKKDVKENIDNYSLDDIEAKLSIICVRKKVNFDSEDSAENKNNTEEENTTVTTYNLEQESNVPAWISACINTQNSKK